jgi:dihydroorotate dehydrogenase (NAD+) catalytic subunit
MLAGATTVQVGTQSFIDPAAAERVLAEIVSYCRRHGVSDVRELVGGLRTS